jgi:hypothetical protein
MEYEHHYFPWIACREASWGSPVSPRRRARDNWPHPLFGQGQNGKQRQRHCDGITDLGDERVAGAATPFDEPDALRTEPVNHLKEP